MSVSCPTDTDCVAVGSYSSSTLLGVSCATATNCLAVGNAETNLHRFSLVEHYG